MDAYDFQARIVNACIYGDLHELRDLLDNDPMGQEFDINKDIDDSWSLLHVAVYHNILDCVRFLVERGSNINAQDNDGWSPLHIAADESFPDCVQLLIELGANSEILNDESRTAYDMAYDDATRAAFGGGASIKSAN